MNKNISGVGEVTTPSTPKEKIQNFWYHYKWHSLIALFLVITTLVCSLQFCNRVEYDAYILYAGNKNIGRTAQSGDVAEIVKVISALKRITEDFDENDEISVNFLNYYYLSKEEMSDNQNVNNALLASDQQALSSALEHSEYYLCFISPAVYEKYHQEGEREIFISLSEYRATYQDIDFYSDCAINLSSTKAYSIPGLSNLPVDTLICIRQPNYLANRSKEHTAHFNNAKKILNNLLELENS